MQLFFLFRCCCFFPLWVISMNRSPLFYVTVCIICFSIRFFYRPIHNFVIWFEFDAGFLPAVMSTKKETANSCNKNQKLCEITNVQMARGFAKVFSSLFSLFVSLAWARSTLGNIFLIRTVFWSGPLMRQCHWNFFFTQIIWMEILIPFFPFTFHKFSPLFKSHSI